MARNYFLDSFFKGIATGIELKRLMMEVDEKEALEEAGDTLADAQEQDWTKGTGPAKATAEAVENLYDASATTASGAKDPSKIPSDIANMAVKARENGVPLQLPDFEGKEGNIGKSQSGEQFSFSGVEPSEEGVRLDTGQGYGRTLSSGGDVELTGDMNEDAARIRAGLINRGIPDNAATGITMNLISESGLDSGIKGDGGKSFGLAQWYADRGRKMKASAREKGVRWDDPNHQLDFLVKELKTEYSGAYAAMTENASPQQAADIFLKQYEVPAAKYRRQRSQKYLNTDVSSLPWAQRGVSTTEPGMNIDSRTGAIPQGEEVRNPDYIDDTPGEVPAFSSPTPAGIPEADYPNKYRLGDQKGKKKEGEKEDDENKDEPKGLGAIGTEVEDYMPPSGIPMIERGFA